MYDIRIFFYILLNYCVPDAIYKDCIEKLKEVYPDSIDRPNVISYSDSGVLNFHGKSASYCRGKHRKLFLEEQLKLARLGALRYWSSEFKRLRCDNQKGNSEELNEELIIGD